jgi:glycine/serine hydroxymethyltransferase
MREGEMRQIGKWMDEVISHVDDEAVIARVGAEVREFCHRLPAPGILLQ